MSYAIEISMQLVLGHNAKQIPTVEKIKTHLLFPSPTTINAFFLRSKKHDP